MDGLHLSALLALSIAATPASQEPAPAPQDGASRESTLKLVSVGDGSHRVERGMLRVPLVRLDPDSAMIEVEVYRFPADEGALSSTPPIFLLHGGPGWGGIDLARMNFQREVDPYTELADLVVVGQRGIGKSRPNTECPPMETPEGVEWTPAQRLEALRAGCRACRTYWEEKGYDLRGFNVIEAAADVADVRRLLGYERITLRGTSFGSHWAMAILRYHRGIVARALMSGMEGPDHTYDMPGGVLAALERIAAEAEGSATLDEHVPDGGLIEALRTVIGRLENEPIEVPLPRPGPDGPETIRIGADEIRDLATGYRGTVGSRTRVGGWPADVIALYRDRFEPAAQVLAARRAGDAQLPSASFFMLDCGSGISPERLERLHADPAREIVGDLGRFYESACPEWGADLGEEFRAGFTTDVPTVIVHGTWDVSTPFDNAVELVPSFTNVQFVIVEGGTHGALEEAKAYSPEFTAALRAFLATGDMDELPGEVYLPPIRWTVPRD